MLPAIVTCGMFLIWAMVGVVAFLPRPLILLPGMTISLFLTSSAALTVNATARAQVLRQVFDY